ncbi:MAG: hypothetical protein Q8R63_05735 [Ramlibacter sp.]|nr:hypothetical protein [Ramlibacter sp.]
MGCPAQPVYPLPVGPSQLRELADRLDALAIHRACLPDAVFHAWRGAVLVALGRAAEAVEALERALLLNPDLPGATLDLAQALALQGDQASATALLAPLRDRPDLPPAIRDAIDRRTVAITQQAAVSAPDNGNGWQSRWQIATMGGTDTNLNNAPSGSEITLTLPQGNVTLPLDPAGAPRKGPAILNTALWQGLKAHGDAVWVLQGDLRTRHTGESATSYQQADISASWLQFPAAPRQWVARTSASYLRFGGQTLLQAYRASLQHQWESLPLPLMPTALEGIWSCRPSVALEWEHRRYPSSASLDGQLTGFAAGLLCRADRERTDEVRSAGIGFLPDGNLNLQLRTGSDRPSDAGRAGGTYRKSEARAQYEAPVLSKGRLGVQLSTTVQTDSEPYSPLLGNVPRKVRRSGLQIDGSWPVEGGLSLIGAFEASRQRSNLSIFQSNQRSLYLGLRWE